MKYVKVFEEYNYKKCIKNSNGNCTIFYHVSNIDNIQEFKPTRNTKKSHKYIFFSTDIDSLIIDEEFTYEVNLDCDIKKIFNVYNFITKSDKLKGIENNFNKHKEEIIKLLNDNIDYFYNEWEKVGVDNPDEVSQNYDEELSKLDLLVLFLTEWNDSWVILETDKFIDFIESKGYMGFITMEEGKINIAIKDPNCIKIIKKYKTWD